VPDRAKAAALGQRREAVEPGGDKNRLLAVALVAPRMDIMDINVAGGVARDRHINGVMAILLLAGVEEVLEPPELIKRAHPKLLPLHADPHAPVKRPLKYRQAAIGFEPDHEQLPRLIGGERKAGFLPGQPGSEQAGAGELQSGFGVGHKQGPAIEMHITRVRPSGRFRIIE
jgi:hypothetical protein